MGRWAPPERLAAGRARGRRAKGARPSRVGAAGATGEGRRRSGEARRRARRGRRWGPQRPRARCVRARRGRSRSRASRSCSSEEIGSGARAGRAAATADAAGPADGLPKSRPSMAAAAASAARGESAQVRKSGGLCGRDLRTQPPRCTRHRKRVSDAARAVGPTVLQWRGGEPGPWCVRPFSCSSAVAPDHQTTRHTGQPTLTSATVAQRSATLQRCSCWTRRARWRVRAVGWAHGRAPAFPPCLPAAPHGAGFACACSAPAPARSVAVVATATATARLPRLTTGSAAAAGASGFACRPASCGDRKWWTSLPRCPPL